MYTKEEKRQIRKSRRAVVKDIRKIWKMYPYGEIEVPVKLNMREYGNYWRLIIDKKQIVIKSDNDAYTRLYPRTTSRNREDGYRAHSQFITQYEEIRKDILEIVNRRLESKNEHIKSLEDVSSKLNKKEEKPKEAEVRIDLPNSINAKEIYVSEEGNKKIGVIDFGQQTIKIITEGNIVLVNKPKEDTKVKRK